MSVDLSTWLSRAEAAARLGISERKLERLDAKGQGPERRERPRAGMRPEIVYNPEDVDLERMAAPKLHVMPERWEAENRSPALVNGSSEITIADLQAASSQLAVVDRLAERLAVWLPPRPPVPYLTLREAAARRGLSVTLIRRLVRDGKLPAIVDGSVKVLQSDVDQLDGVTVREACRSPKLGCPERRRSVAAVGGESGVRTSQP